jgi:sulfur carrier protein ThiS adenylyltransferase
MNAMNSTSLATVNRDLRQRGLVPPERLAQCDAVVIGVGAIGRQVAIQLAALGIARLTLFDDDCVQVENLAVQGYWPEDILRPKVDATAELCRRMHPSIQLNAVPERFKRSTPRPLSTNGDRMVFCCVDSIVTRRQIWESVRTSASFFVDGRMNAEVMRVIAAEEPAVDTYYQGTLFQAEEAFAGPCTARSTIYTASIAAGLMVHQFTKWLRGIPVDCDVTLNLLAAELLVKVS